MKFLCVDCDTQMASTETAAPEDGTLAIYFRCPDCQRQIAMLANPMETQMVRGLCVDVGGRSEPERPLEGVIEHMEVRNQTEPEAPTGVQPVWSPRAEERLGRVPGFVRGMVRRLYVDWARDHGLTEITMEVMDRARSELGLEDTAGLD